VNSRTTKQFRKQLARLPRDVQKQAKKAYKLFKKNPYDSSLHFKCIDPQESLWSARVGYQYRVVGVREGDTILWYFIGSHADYDHLS